MRSQGQERAKAFVFREILETGQAETLFFLVYIFQKLDLNIKLPPNHIFSVASSDF